MNRIWGDTQTDGNRRESKSREIQICCESFAIFLPFFVRLLSTLYLEWAIYIKRNWNWMGPNENCGRTKIVYGVWEAHTHTSCLTLMSKRIEKERRDARNENEQKSHEKLVIFMFIELHWCKMVIPELSLCFRSCDEIPLLYVYRIIVTIIISN